MDADGTLSYSQPREVIFIHGIHFDTLGSSKKKISWFSWYEKWQVVKDYLARFGTMSCIYDMQWFMKKSLENRLGISVRCEKKTISSIVRNSSNRSRENTKFRIPKVTIITPNCQLFCWGHPSKLGDIPPRNLLGIAMNHPMLTAITATKMLNSYGNTAAYPCALHSTLQPRLSVSSFNSLIDFSLE